MKLTPTLFQQHAGRMFRDHWKIQGKKRVTDHGALKVLTTKGIEFIDALDFVKEKSPKREKWELKGFRPEPEVLNETHPDYNEIPCVTYGDNNVLLEGITQAKVLTNTVELEPNNLAIMDDLQHEQKLPLQDKLVKRCIRSSLLYDATQLKLPVRKDPVREAWRFARDYGIPDKRKSYLLVNRLLQLCSSFSPQLLGQRFTYNAAKFVLPVKLPSEQKILFSVTGDAVVFANKHPNVGHIQQSIDLELPDISPLAPTVSLQSENFYKFEPSFPLSSDANLNKVHTLVLHYDKSKVNNLFESPVTPDQILGRSLMQAWIIAMSQVTQDNGGNLTEPVTVQTVQTNGHFFHFSVLQLNSTSCGLANAPKNFYWSFPVMNIYDDCSYQKGIPVLEGYNPKVFQTLLAFYNNC